MASAVVADASSSTRSARSRSVPIRKECAKRGHSAPCTTTGSTEAREAVRRGLLAFPILRPAAGSLSVGAQDHATSRASHAVDFDPPIYNVWKQQGKTAGSNHFGNRNALKHGEFSAETLALKREIQTLAPPMPLRSSRRASVPGCGECESLAMH